MRDRIVAHVLLDATWRDIYQQPDGRQYVLDDTHGVRVSRPVGARLR
jgi:hypothetical protein